MKWLTWPKMKSMLCWDKQVDRQLLLNLSMHKALAALTRMKLMQIYWVTANSVSSMRLALLTTTCLHSLINGHDLEMTEATQQPLWDVSRACSLLSEVETSQHQHTRHFTDGTHDMITWIRSASTWWQPTSIWSWFLIVQPETQHATHSPSEWKCTPRILPRLRNWQSR